MVAVTSAALLLVIFAALKVFGAPNVPGLVLDAVLFWAVVIKSWQP